MAKVLKDYLEILKRISKGRPAKESVFYKWKDIEANSQGEQEIRYGICGSCKTFDCATKVHLKDGIVTKIEGNPACPPNYGSLCARGGAEIMSLYNPYRVKTPLVRTNPQKGLDIDPMWKEISWDEALDIVAKHLKQIREKDPRCLVLCEGVGNEESIFRDSFCRAYGTPNLIASRGPLCTVHYASCLVQASMPSSVVDAEYSQYLIGLGTTLGANFASAGATRRFSKAIERGMKLVVIDPRSSYEASKGEWIPIRPGSDYALLLAMANIIMHEGLNFDAWFIKYRTNAPYLIGPDGNYYRNPETGKPIMWDSVTNTPKAFDAEFKDIALEGTYLLNGVNCHTAFSLIKAEFLKYTPEWAETICTIPAKTIRRLTRELVENARIGSTIEIDGFTFPFRPASIKNGRGINNHRGGTYADLTGKMINMLLGNIEVPGGVVGDGRRGPVLAPDEDGVVKPIVEAVGIPFKFPPEHIDSAEFYPNKHTGPHLTAKAILNPEKYYHNYRVEAWLTTGGNPIRKTGQPQWYVKALTKIPFMVSIAYHMDEAAILADVVLPEHCALERHLVKAFRPASPNTSKEICGLHMAYLREPVPHVFNTMHMDDILQELADRIGILYGKGGLYDHFNRMNGVINQSDGMGLDENNVLDLDRKYTLQEISDRQLKSWKYGNGQGIEELKTVGAFNHRGPEKEFYNYYYFPDNKTRHPFYFQHLKDVGDKLRANLVKHNISFPGIVDTNHIFDLYRPIPHWVENSEFRAPEEFDLWVINWRTPYLSNDSSNVSGNPWLVELSEKDPFESGIYINSLTAKRKNLKEGDMVIIESRYGKTEGRLRLTELLHPDALGIPGCGGLGTLQSNPILKRGANWNSLLPIDENSLDAVSAGMESSPRVKVYPKQEIGRHVG